MPKLKAETEYTSNNSFMTSQVKAPKPFGGDYEDPLEALKAQASNGQSKVFPLNSSENPKEERIVTNLTELTNLTTPTELTGLTELTNLSQPKKNQPVSPIRDFTKTPNSIGRHVMAKGLFKGKSKQIYDFLWNTSRGNINPTRIVRKTHGEIQNGTGIGSLNTIKNGLKYLDQIGLISKTSAVGEASGNIYEIFTPEEVNLVNDDRPVRPVSSVSSVSQELVQPVRPETDRTNLTQVVSELTSYSDPKTSFKDNSKTIDDELLTAIERFKNAVRNVTGAEPTEKDLQAAATIFDLIIDITAVAATKTKVTSYGQFALTNLQRRLATAKPQRTEKAKPFEPGKDEPIIEAEVFMPEPLSVQGREVVLNNLRRMPREAADGYQDHYTAEDWEWLVEKLG